MDPMKRMFVVGLTVPAAVTGIVVLAVWPNSLMQWLIVAATPFVTSSAVAMAYAYRSR
ncbi:hypothetical protein [Streptomyces sp. LUP47B]|uniref:hypothetical protein n=1 Tax=Streptomyces sp. LUP47B TaxID=1890286 RepID=UPI00159F1715|nr:hypothetical protein [Streptomyces sp. LUP47B]